MNNNKKILIGSTVRQSPEILKNFIAFLKGLVKKDVTVDYFFIDDNEIKESSDVLTSFSHDKEEKVIIESGDKVGKYITTGDTHCWKDSLVWKIAGYKNKIIEYAKNNYYDYLFLIDSDLILEPNTLMSLVGSKKDIISEIFWTSWGKNTVKSPQVWVSDEYSFVKKEREEVLTAEEYNRRYRSFLQRLKKPGIYEVGGLGACTLISRKAMESGVNFGRIYNLSFWGEDRHFCIRAAALGFKLYVDTKYPALHLYRSEDLVKVERFKLTGMCGAYGGVNEENFARKFIENLYSYDYKKIGEFQVEKYMNESYRKRFDAEKENIIKYIIKNKCLCNVKIFNIDVCGDEIKTKFELNYSDAGKKLTRIFYCIMLFDTESVLVRSIKVLNEDKKQLFGSTILDLLNERIRVDKQDRNKITLAMLVRNESGKFLKEVLQHASGYVDNAVILDDASEDNSIDICIEALKDIPIKIVHNEKHGFDNEINLRKQLWDITIDTKPDWILFLDADEIFEDRICGVIRDLVDQPSFDYYSFRLYDMWDENHYREDVYWSAHKYYRPLLIRYQPDFEYTWNELPLHCGRMPKNIFELSGCVCYVKLKHLGWSTPELRKLKYERYMKADPEGKYGLMGQYESILDKNPTLIKME